MALCEIAEESISHISQFTQIGFTKEFADQKVHGFNYGMKARLYFYLLERMPCFTLKTIKCNIFALLSENVLSDIWKNPAYRKEKVYSHDEYMDLLLGDKLKSFIAGTLIYRKYYSEHFQDGNLVEDYAYHPHLMKYIPNILVISDPNLYHYTPGRPGSTTNLTGTQASGISARLSSAVNRYREYHTRYPDACGIVLGQIADYAVMEILLDDRGTEGITRRVLQEYRGLFMHSKYVPGFRKIEIACLYAFPRSRHLLGRLHKWKGRHFGIRKTDRRLR